MSRMKVLLAGALGLAVASVQAQYTEALGKKIRANLTEGKEWRAVKYPTDNFGVGTMYDDKGDKGFICATATCLGISNAWDTNALGKYLASGTGGSINLSDTEKRGFVIEAMIPKVLSLASLGGSFNRNAVTVTTVELPEAQKRMLDRDALLKRIQSLDSNTSAARRAYDDGELRIVVGDLVVNGIKATIKVDKAIDAGLVARLEKLADSAGPSAATGAATAASKVAGAQKDTDAKSQQADKASGGAKPTSTVATELAGGPGLGVKVTAGTNGTFTMETKRPVIVAVLIKKQPAAGRLGQGTLNNWPADTELQIDWLETLSSQ